MGGLRPGCGGRGYRPLEDIEPIGIGIARSLPYEHPIGRLKGGLTSLICLQFQDMGKASLWYDVLGTREFA